MADQPELRQRLQQMAELVQGLEEIADPRVRAAARDLVQLLMDVHGAAFERILEKVFELGEPGQRLIDELGGDPVISGLLVLYGLHPADLESRVAGALQKTGKALHAHGAGAELLAVQGGEVHLRVNMGGHSCGSTAGTLRKMVEDAVYEAAPEITSLTIEGLEGKPASGFVSLEKLVYKDLPADALSAPRSASEAAND